MRVGVIGAGTMGSGIAQVGAMAGHEVSLCDNDSTTTKRAIETMRTSLARFASKDRLGSDTPDEVLERVRIASSIADTCQRADVVIESVVERIEIKHEVFEQIVKFAPDDALLGTNTSQLSITSVSSVIRDEATRLIGMHFFNPPVLMKLVELVKGMQTAETTVTRAEEFAHSLGKETVVCRKDSPGFLTSRISAIVRLECLKMVEEGVGTPADIDKALRLGLNFPMGPLELGDFNGLDTYLDALESLATLLGERFRPTITLRNLVAAGRLGRKTGWGIYKYGLDGKIELDAQE